MTLFFCLVVLFAQSQHLSHTGVNLLLAGHGRDADDAGGAFFRGDQYPMCITGAYGNRHLRCDLSQHGIGKGNANGADDHICTAALHDNSIFARCPLICACIDHTTGGQCVCANSDDAVSVVQADFPQALDDLCAKAAALAVNDQEFHDAFTPLLLYLPIIAKGTILCQAMELLELR